MDENRRNTEQQAEPELRRRPRTAVEREQPRPPRNRPTSPRPRTGNAASRSRERIRRLSGGDEAEDVIPDTADPEDGAAAEEPLRKKKKKKKKPHRIYNTNFGFKFLTMLAVVAVILLSMVLFFKVKHIYVEIIPPLDENGVRASSTYYTPEEIIEISGIHIDENLLSLRKAEAAANIRKLPYIDEIQIKKKLPGSVVITVSEFGVTYGIEDENRNWWLINREGRVMEPADSQTAKTHLIVTGMRIQAPELGDYIKPVAADGADLSELAAKRTGAIDVLTALETAPFAKQIVSVDVSTSYDIVLWYGTQYEIKLGNTENLAYKLQFLQATLEELGKDHYGTIDVTFNEDNKAHYRPPGK